MHVGLDFGTTNSTAAVYDGAEVRFIPLDPAAANPAVMRSALFIGRDGELLTGKAAIDHYTASNVGRELVYERRYIGETELTLADIGTIVQSLFAVVDANAPERLFQSLKTVLRDPSYTSTDVYGTRWSIEQLVAALLSEIKHRIEDYIGEPITSVTIGRPVHYASTPQGDALALERMRRACELAGLPQVTFLEEPVAAAYAYAKEIDALRHILVFDFGGGTLDVTVMALDQHGRRQVLATGGVPVGGDVLDSRIVMGALLPYFGAGAVLGPRKLPLPAFLLDGLESWQSILELHTPRTLGIIEEAIATSNKPQELKALRSLIRENYGLLLYAEVEQAKCRVSTMPQTEIKMDAGEIHFCHTLTRIEFERLIGPETRAIAGCVDDVLDAACLWPDQIDVVLRTGGSSRIPRFVRLLCDRFGSDKLREQDPFTSVGAGLAVAAWERAQGAHARSV
ncbi:MAG: hsp70 family protein [Herpetosiphonaceae bacterium]|nr:MAG: hsp70 family protein [Herpetosiphonaceae bacterium]